MSGSDDDDSDDERRWITPSDARVLARASAEETDRRYQSSLRAQQLRELELRDAEWFGRDGNGGRLAIMEAKIERHEAKLTDLDHFKTKILAYVAAGGAMAGILAGAIYKAFEYFSK